MNRLILSTILMFINTLTYSQTKLTIIGCSHVKTQNFNADSVLNILNRVKPDIILCELDTSLMDLSGNLKGRAINSTDNELIAARQYKVLNPVTIFRRFDIEGRNAYYAAKKTFYMENKLGHTLDSLYNSKKLDSRSTEIITEVYRVNQQLNTLNQKDIHTINSVKYMNIAKLRQYWLYKKELEVVANNEVLKPYYTFWKDNGDFWASRNKRMIDNISDYLKSFSGKNIVVLTGAMHKYYLTDGLSPLQNKLNFILENLPE